MKPETKEFLSHLHDAFVFMLLAAGFLVITSALLNGMYNAVVNQ